MTPAERLARIGITLDASCVDRETIIFLNGVRAMGLLPENVAIFQAGACLALDAMEETANAELIARTKCKP